MDELQIPQSLIDSLKDTTFNVEDPTKRANFLKHSQKSRSIVEKNIAEYKENDRRIRPTQVDLAIKDKIIGEGENIKVVPSNRVKIPVQKKIVLFSAAFEAGAPVEITHNEPNDLFNEVIMLWRDKLRIDDLFLKAKILQKSESQCAIIFYMHKKSDDDNNTSMKAMLLKNENGEMSPIFDQYGDMVSFIWRFSKKEEERTVNYVWVYDKVNRCVFKANGESNYELIEVLPHKFDVIPVVYMSQEEVEWEDVKSLIDRYEVILSRLGGSNDYSAYPILKIFGEITNPPEKNDDGKILQFDQRLEGDDSNPTLVQGDAEFLTASNAAESIKLEFDKLEASIFSNTSTPNLAFDNLKSSIGNISGIALRMLFLDSEIKAILNQGDNRTALQRIFNVIASGVATTLLVKLKSSREKLKPIFKFSSIIPEDVAGLVTQLSTAKTSGFISTETAVKKAGMVPQDMVDDEVSKIKDERTIG